jgi:hypothetical protein
MRRGLVLAVTLGVALFSVVAPAAASHTADHAADQIRDIVAQADDDMDQVVSGFEAQSAGFDDQSQVDSAEDDANQRIETIWGAAKTSIEDLVKLYPGELGAAGGTAKQEIQDKRQASRTEIAAVANSWAPAATTTTTAPTTTTTTPATTTTRPPNQGNGVGPPAPGTNNGGGNSGGGSAPPEAPPEATPVEPPTSPASPGGIDTWIVGDPIEDPQTDTSLVLATEASGRPVAFGPEAIGSADRNQSGATAGIASLLETVLPPALVDLVLSPMLILEILIRTVIDGGAAVLGPLSLLAICAYVIFRYDRSLKRDRFVDGVDPGVMA